MTKRLRSLRARRRPVDASQTVEFRAEMRALVEWLTREFPEEYEALRLDAVNQPKRELPTGTGAGT